MTAESPERPPLRDRCEALVEEWKESAEIDAALGQHDAADRRDQCADELEAVLEDYDR